MVERHIRLVFTRGTPTPAVLFHYGEKRPKNVYVSDSAHELYSAKKTEKQNPEGCKCIPLHLPAAALVHYGKRLFIIMN